MAAAGRVHGPAARQVARATVATTLRIERLDQTPVTGRIALGQVCPLNRLLNITNMKLCEEVASIAETRVR